MNTHKIKTSMAPIIPMPVAPERATPPCTCVDYNPLECMAKRHDTASTLIRLCGDGAGCACPCHKTANGAHVSHSAWVNHRYVPRTKMAKNKRVTLLSEDEE